LPGSFSPHYDGERKRRPTFQKYIAQAKMLAGYAADDGAAFHYVGEQLCRVVSSRQHAKGYSVNHTTGGVVEQQVPTDYLGRGV
jgi:dipeptidase E